MLDIENGVVILDHGTGAKLSEQLISWMTSELEEVHIGNMEDSAVLTVNASQIAVTTDSYVVTPLDFIGGNIGKIAVCGTVNDLAVSGARPLYITLAMIIEAGLPLKRLQGYIHAVRDAAREANVKVVAGDTKVVGKGEADGIFLNTTGVGVFERAPLSISKVNEGDRIIVTGELGNHSIHLLSVREGLGFERNIHSDCAPLASIIDQVLTRFGDAVKSIRDVTRGGLCQVLNEYSRDLKREITIRSDQLPIRYETAMAADMLGVNPLHLANEGCLCLFVDEAAADEIVTMLQGCKYTEKARVVGEVGAPGEQLVVQILPDGDTKVLEQLEGAELPRLC